MVIFLYLYLSVLTAKNSTSPGPQFLSAFPLHHIRELKHSAELSNKDGLLGNSTTLRR